LKTVKDQFNSQAQKQTLKYSCPVFVPDQKYSLILLPFHVYCVKVTNHEAIMSSNVSNTPPESDLVPDDNPAVVEEYDTELGQLSSSLIHDHLMLMHQYGITREDAFSWMQAAGQIISSLGYVYLGQPGEDD
jgi:hypothetical protein